MNKKPLVQNKENKLNLSNNQKNIEIIDEIQNSDVDFLNDEFKSEFELNLQNTKIFYNFYKNSSGLTAEQKLKYVGQRIKDIESIRKKMEESYKKIEIRAFMDEKLGIGFASPFELKEYLGLKYNLVSYYIGSMLEQGQITWYNGHIKERQDIILLDNRTSKPPRDFYTNVRDDEFNKSLKYLETDIYNKFLPLKQKYSSLMDQLPEFRRQAAIKRNKKSKNDYARLEDFFSDKNNVIELITSNNGNPRFTKDHLIQTLIFSFDFLKTNSLTRVEKMLKYLSRSNKRLLEITNQGYYNLYFEKSIHYNQIEGFNSTKP